MLHCINCRKPVKRLVREDPGNRFTVVRRCPHCREEWTNSLDQPASSQNWRDLYYKEIARNEQLSQDLQKAQDLADIYQQLILSLAKKTP